MRLAYYEGRLDLWITHNTHTHIHTHTHTHTHTNTHTHTHMPAGQVSHVEAPMSPAILPMGHNSHVVNGSHPYVPT